MEEWKTIPTHSRYDISIDSKVRNNRTGKEVKAIITERGYKAFRVYDGDKKKSTFKAHKKLWETFNNCECKGTVDHIDSDITNNHLSNLQCITHQENSKKRTIYGYNPPSDELKREILLKIKKEGYSLTRISREYGYMTNYISVVLKRGSWNYLIDDSKTIRQLP